MPPNTILAEFNYFPHVTTVDDIDDDPENPDGAWCTWDGDGNMLLDMGFPTPSGQLATGADLQTFKVLVRRNGATANAEYIMYVMENGTVRAQVASGTLTDTTPVIVTGTWNASLLSNLSGSGVELRFHQTLGGIGTPRSGIEIGAVEWCATITSEYSSGSSNSSSSSSSSSSSQSSSSASSSSESSSSSSSVGGAGIIHPRSVTFSKTNPEASNPTTESAYPMQAGSTSRTGRSVTVTKTNTQ